MSVSLDELMAGLTRELKPDQFKDCCPKVQLAEIKALGRLLARRFDLQYPFIDINNLV